MEESDEIITPQISVCLYLREKGRLGTFLGRYTVPTLPRNGEFIQKRLTWYEVVEVRYLLDGPAHDGFNWVDILVIPVK